MVTLAFDPAADSNVVPLFPPIPSAWLWQWEQVHKLNPPHKLMEAWEGRQKKGRLGFKPIELAIYRYIWKRYLAFISYADPHDIKPERKVRIPRSEIAEAVGCELHQVSKATKNLAEAGVIVKKAVPDGRNRTAWSPKALKTLTYQYDEVFYGLPYGEIAFPSFPTVVYTPVVQFTTVASRWLTGWLKEHSDALPIATKTLYRLCLEDLKDRGITAAELSSNAFGRVANKKLVRKHTKHGDVYVAIREEKR
jgi:DNA-binding MarR family transcriptional regulator